MLPGIVDLHNNVRRNGATLTFSTGSTIPATILRGRVYDWVTGQVAPRAFIQAFKPTDTTLVFVAEADSNGTFILPHLAPAQYVVRGFVDANHNRKLDRTEIWDTTHINLVDSARVEILAFSHDTIGPRISEVTVRDSVTLRVTLDRGLDTTTRISPATFTLKDKDSALVLISGARSAASYDSAADSAARVHTDSIFRSDSARRAAAGLGITDTALARRREARIAARRDSLALLRRPRPSKPSPIHEIVVQLGTPLKPGYYRLSAANLRGLLGKERSSDRVFNVPKPPEADSAARAREHADSANKQRRAPLGPGAPPSGGTAVSQSRPAGPAPAVAGQSIRAQHSTAGGRAAARRARLVDTRRTLPSVHALVEDELVRPLLERAPRPLVTDAVRIVIERARQDPTSAPRDRAGWATAVGAALAERERASLRPVYNATGVVLHTNLGRAPLADAALAAIQQTAAGYSNLEYDLAQGTRGSRYDHCVTLLREVTGAEDAIVVNNCAAALVLALNTAADGREALVSRGELIEIGGSFRVPDIMAKSGARLVEVGTTNRTYAADYAAALTDRTGAIVKVHRSNFRLRDSSRARPSRSSSHWHTRTRFR